MELKPFDIIRVVDTETTGFAPPAAEMVELGWTDITVFHDGMRITSDQNSLFVNPGRRIPTEVTAVHGITDEMVKDGIAPDDARERASKGAAVLVAHNARFDKQFLPSRLPWICTMTIARRVWPKGKVENHKNMTLKAALGIEVEGDAHRAGFDTAVTARIFLHLTKHYTVAQMIQMSDPNYVPSQVMVGKNAGMRFEQCDDGYLRWVINQSEFTPGEKAAAKNILTLREAERVAATPVRKAANPDWDKGF